MDRPTAQKKTQVCFRTVAFRLNEEGLDEYQPSTFLACVQGFQAQVDPQYVATWQHVDRNTRQISYEIILCSCLPTLHEKQGFRTWERSDGPQYAERRLLNGSSPYFLATSTSQKRHFGSSPPVRTQGGQLWTRPPKDSRKPSFPRSQM